MVQDHAAIKVFFGRLRFPLNFETMVGGAKEEKIVTRMPDAGSHRISL
jgi:hypothetical protein